MIRELRKMLRKQEGFTLVELMTVLIILGVILGIGVPRYLKIQAKAEWDADYTTIMNIARTAEIYAAQKNLFGQDIKLSDDLINKQIIDGDLVLNRNATGKNSSKVTLKNMLTGEKANLKFSIDANTGKVTDNSFKNVVKALIGESPY